MKEEDIPPEFKDGQEIIQDIEKYNEKIETVKFILKDIIGKGGFSECYKCYCPKDKAIYAAKKIIIKNNLSNGEFEKRREMISNEIKIYDFIEHKNIVDLKYHFVYEENQYLIFEMCQNKDLSNLIKNRDKLKEIEVQYYIKNLIDALIHLHERNIIHRDFKLGNIFLTDKMELKLGDFSLAKKLSSRNDILTEVVGTRLYMAPELIEKPRYSFEVDIWAIGIIMYYLIIGKRPFKDPEEIKKKNCEFPENAIISKAAKNLIEQILVKDPKQRPNLYQILRHDFFSLGRAIPRLIPKVFINKPPSINYIRNFMEDADENGIVDREVKETRLIDIEIEKEEEKEGNRPDIYITKCKEIQKYGLGYRLSNNKFGVCFNDTTKMLHEPTSNEFFYAGIKEFGNYYKIEELESLKNNDLNKLNKKFNILKSFEEVLSKDKNTSTTSSPSEKIKYNKGNQNRKREDNPVYVKKYYSFDDKSLLIRLNNRDIQIYFNNNEHILLSKEEKEVTFIKKNKDQLQTLKYPLSEIAESNNYDLLKKLQYTKNILERVMAEDIRA